MKAQDITLCLTIGRRPELLRQTLESLFSQISFEHIIAINDFRDEETNQVFRELCPTGILLNLAEQVGHHKAVDVMYAQVKTNYIFHCEDDWLFDQPIQIEEYINIKGIPLKLIDTAGIRETNDIIEEIGVNKSINLINEADLIISIFDNSILTIFI